MCSVCGSMNFGYYSWINNTKGMDIPFICVLDFLEPPILGGISPSLSKIRKLCVSGPFLLLVSSLAGCPAVSSWLWLPLSQGSLEDSLGPHFHTTLRPASCKIGFIDIMIEWLGHCCPFRNCKVLLLTTQLMVAYPHLSIVNKYSLDA